MDSLPFPAKYDGVCSNECGSRIHPGDSVKYVDDALMHEDCAPKRSKYDLAPDESVCGVCWTIRPCKCVD